MVDGVEQVMLSVALEATRSESGKDAQHFILGERFTSEILKLKFNIDDNTISFFKSPPFHTNLVVVVLIFLHGTCARLRKGRWMPL